MAGIDAIDGEEGVRSSPALEKGLVVEHTEIVPEPDDRHAGAWPLRAGGAVP